jgi:hypothetical protein
MPQGWLVWMALKVLWSTLVRITLVPIRIFHNTTCVISPLRDTFSTSDWVQYHTDTVSQDSPLERARELPQTLTLSLSERRPWVFMSPEPISRVMILCYSFSVCGRLDLHLRTNRGHAGTDQPWNRSDLKLSLLRGRVSIISSLVNFE